MAIRVGDTIPHFTSVDALGNQFNSNDYVGRKALVIYFYPKDETRVCTAQACSFRDQYEVFKELGAEVIGISSDSVTSHRKFAQNHRLPFLLLADTNQKIQKLFGVRRDWFGMIPGRETFVVDQHGTIIMVFDSTSGEIHIQKALEALKKIN
ncbi:peroxiredoxin [Flavobacterium sp. CYK-4]|uniref:peroxiredoxin n=1 Tax=Flavobacterium lotistagni TaxID=2709660 RepID=UPI001409FB4B|nr:peroxiredoxin [Flavobacterium lotistagni]NHM06377.1 peroxiredoxin [Flavobacterium lotistagni]